MIKFLDINKQDKKIRNKIYSDVKKIINKNNFILGEYVLKFEKKFSKFCGSKYGIGCANGTDALTIALKSLNLKNGSEVIIPNDLLLYAFIVINAGLKPVLIDIDYLRPTISLEKLKDKINKNTKVTMPVHLYGSVVDIEKIKKIVGKRKFIL